MASLSSLEQGQHESSMAEYRRASALAAEAKSKFGGYSIQYGLAVIEVGRTWGALCALESKIGKAWAHA